MPRPPLIGEAIAMEHLVRFHTPEGRDGQHSSESLDDALKFAERLRNAEGATDVRVFRLHEVGFEFKPYYRVELSTGDAAEPEALPAAPSEARPSGFRPWGGEPSAAPGPADSPVAAAREPDGVPATVAVASPASDGGRRLFGR